MMVTCLEGGSGTVMGTNQDLEVDWRGLVVEKVRVLGYEMKGACVLSLCLRQLDR